MWVSLAMKLTGPPGRNERDERMRKITTAWALMAVFLLGACAPGMQESPGPVISVPQLAERIEGGSPPLILDVRSPGEYARGHIPGAVNIPHNELAARLVELPVEKSAEVIVYCHSGPRAWQAEKMLGERGYSSVQDLSGHWQAWQAAGLPGE